MGKRRASVIEVRFSYREAARLLGVRRETVSDLARRHGLARDGSFPLDRPALEQLARLLRVEIEIHF